MSEYEKILSSYRLQKSSIQGREKIEEFYSDRSRIIYSSSFRRLQQKAQVFSLESNSSVRTRLTHSIEVSDLGRTLANKIGYKLLNLGKITQEEIPMIVAIVENACLLHDIGNPPFGHFGEAAIKEWSNKYLDNIEIGHKNDKLWKQLIKDFKEFDGNPQGFRIISKLHCERDKYSFNLTYATLLCGLKYAKMAGINEESGKAGYFQSEKDIVKKIHDDMKMSGRYPLTYIMEAADDIAYCLSDISDGIEKHIITVDCFLDEIRKMWKKTYNAEELPVKISTGDANKTFSLNVSVNWSKTFMDNAVNTYIAQHDDIYNGKLKELISEESSCGKLLAIIKRVSRDLLYASDAAENIELTGYAVITGLLEHFGKLLNVSYKEFQEIMDNSSGKALELRLFHRLGKRYIKRYKMDVEDLNDNEDFEVKERWLRTHLIIDHISGMTDDFALSTYQMLRGIKVDIFK
jgi:dGTPase